jgi:hypothetical protein
MWTAVLGRAKMCSIGFGGLIPLKITDRGDIFTLE